MTFANVGLRVQAVRVPLPQIVEAAKASNPMEIARHAIELAIAQSENTRLVTQAKVGRLWGIRVL